MYQDGPQTAGKAAGKTADSTPAEQVDAPDLVTSFDGFAPLVDYSLMNTLTRDPEATTDGDDHQPRQVFSGHYVPVTPSPIADPVYVSHSASLFRDIGLADELAQDEQFARVFSGDLAFNQSPLEPYGWATGYALSIYGTEYTQQCPFQTGNGYGDGRAISVVEVVSPQDGRRWEMQLKGGGPTPYCRGADGRAVLRSSVREFLAQEFMHALGVPTSRSLTLFASTSETVRRPWYSEGSKSFEPDVMVNNPVAISTRVAPSFLRVGQVELFARRARTEAHPRAMDELKQIVAHVIEREYRDEVDTSLPFEEQIVALADAFRQRLIELVGHWLRVGYCQGNFNSDNCAVGGFTLDYGPFGFMEQFDPRFQPWTGGGQHFSFFNQPAAAEANFHMFWSALSHLVPEGSAADDRFGEVRQGFGLAMQHHVQEVWASKLGLKHFDGQFIGDLLKLMEGSKVDFTIFFRELSQVPDNAAALHVSFGQTPSTEEAQQWQTWFSLWQTLAQEQNGDHFSTLAEPLQRINPKYTMREWLVAPAYQAAGQGDFSLVTELQAVLNDPYGEQTPEVEAKFYQAIPPELVNMGGICHYSCSS